MDVGDVPEAGLLAPGHLDGLVRDLGAQDVLEIVEIFAGSGEEMVPQIAAAVAAGDGGDAGRLAHALRGQALTVGASAVAGVCGEIQQAAGDSSDLARRLQAIWPATTEALRAAAVAGGS